ncbi:MAG: O-antigen ligase family protein [Aggregatilineales bacterium]
MMQRAAHVGAIALFTFLVTIGATFNGILNPEFRLAALIALALCFSLWLLVRAAAGWSWHSTPLDAAILLWAAAFIISLIANLEDWRRIAIGLWYAGAYCIGWYALNDALANRGLRRSMLVDALIFGGLIVMLFAFMQSVQWLRETLPQIVARSAPFSLPRPGSSLGNPNTLATVLVVLLPIAIGRAVTAPHALVRLTMSVYALAAALLLIATFSRGGWLGGVAALVALTIGLAGGRSPLRLTFAGLSALRRVALLTAAAALLLAGLAGLVFVIGTLDEGGRSLDLRTFIFNSALALFAERPLTGHGLFTFGAGLARLNSTPPVQPHSHAHNLPLHVAAELGLIGLAALALLLWLGWRALRRSIAAAEGNARVERIAAGAALVGILAHHLLDMTAMNPAVAVTALLAAVVALAPEPGLRPQTGTAALARTAAIYQAAIALLITGMWSAFVYQGYFAALREGVASGAFAAAARDLEFVFDNDPGLAVYQHQRGFLFGLAAHNGVPGSLDEAIASFERYVTSAPDYAIGWANLAALRAQAGDDAGALAAGAEAARLAARDPTLQFNLGRYAEAAGEPEIAIAAYRAALELMPDVRLDPAWSLSPLRLAAADDPPPLTPYGLMLLALEAGDVSAARALQTAERPAGLLSVDHVFTALIALAEDDRAAAEVALAAAAGAVRELPLGRADAAWVHAGEGAVALAAGDAAGARRARGLALEALSIPLTAEDTLYLHNIHYVQWLRQVIPRQFLPQVGWPLADGALMRLLAALDQNGP